LDFSGDVDKEVYVFQINLGSPSALGSQLK